MTDTVQPEPVFAETATSGEAAARGVFTRLRHDLRTHIDQILGYSELLHDEAEERQLEDFAADVEQIQAAGKQLLALIDGLFQVPDRPASTSGPTDGRDDATSGVGAFLNGEVEGRILVVDDQEANRRLMTRRLEGQGYEVEAAGDGREALHLISAGRFDLVLLDVIMPGMNGIEVLASIRRGWSPAELPVVMVTGQGDSGDVVRALRAGANDYVTKPVDMPVALARVRAQLQLRRSLESLRKLATQVELRNRIIRQVFGRYLTDEVVESLLEDPEGLRLGGENRRITVMMADLRGFTPTARQLPPEKVLQLINTFLGEMSTVIMEFGGTIDEFLGDAVLVLFGAPVPRDDHASAAVACAVQMQQAMEEVNRRNKTQGLPEVEMGIGINTGEVVVGNIGSEKRAKYGVVGHAMNLASRIQSYSRGGQILIAESTLEECGGSVRVNSETEVALKGVPGRVRLFDVGGIGGAYDLFLPRRTTG